mmetsp:Transcript_161773/g.518925  ORF Transcript_161773/g.518925 Transcript_161773/m.518925 type:complete len:296 (-) Transcript_161773:259-1146(-)
MLIVVLAPASPAEGAETETRTSTRVTLPSLLRPMLVPTTAATALAAAAPAGAEERSRPQISMRAMLLMLLERAMLAVVAAVVAEAAEGSQRLTTIHGALPVGLVWWSQVFHITTCPALLVAWKLLWVGAVPAAEERVQTMPSLDMVRRLAHTFSMAGGASEAEGRRKGKTMGTVLIAALSLVWAVREARALCPPASRCLPQAINTLLTNLRPCLARPLQAYDVGTMPLQPCLQQVGSGLAASQVSPQIRLRPRRACHARDTVSMLIRPCMRQLGSSEATRSLPRPREGRRRSSEL